MPNQLTRPNTFHPFNLIQVVVPHGNALVLTLGLNGFNEQRILVDPSSFIELLQMLAYKQIGHSSATLENLGQVLFEFNGAFTVSLGDVVLLIEVGPITLDVRFPIVEDLTP